MCPHVGILSWGHWICISPSRHQLQKLWRSLICRRMMCQFYQRRRKNRSWICSCASGSAASCTKAWKRPKCNNVPSSVIFNWAAWYIEHHGLHWYHCFWQTERERRPILSGMSDSYNSSISVVETSSAEQDEASNVPQKLRLREVESCDLAENLAVEIENRFFALWRHGGESIEKWRPKKSEHNEES